MKKHELTKKLLHLKARQDAGEQMLCQRCGKTKMKRILEHNALSRYADLFVCDTCGIDEALLDMKQTPLPLEEWAALKENQTQLDVEDLT